MADPFPPVLLCEGARDAAFFGHLIESRKLSRFHVTYPTDPVDTPNTQTGGVNGFAEKLQAVKVGSKYRGLSSILIVADNDDDPDESFRKVQEQVRLAGDFGVPEHPLQQARSADGVVVAIMMVPWTGLPGSLESLCLPSMYGKWPAGQACLEAFCACTGTTAWSTTKQAKMRVQVLLSAHCERDPNTTLRYAWSEGRGDPIPLDHKCFDQVVEFLTAFATRP
jgi:hypothetical protein